MGAMLASGLLIDIILALVAIEAITITLYWYATGKGIAPRDLLPNLIAGACLLLALRLTIADFGWVTVCAALAAAGAASTIDLARRWRG